MQQNILKCFFIFALFCGFVAPIFAQEKELKYVKNIHDFKAHTHQHIKEVAHMVGVIFRHAPQLFTDIGITPEKLQRLVLETHDYYKLNHKITVKLYAFYGQGAPREMIGPFDTAEKKLLEKLIEKLGVVDKDKIKSIFNLIELSDLFARWIAPARFRTEEEFGREFTSPSKFFAMKARKNPAKEKLYSHLQETAEMLERYIPQNGINMPEELTEEGFFKRRKKFRSRSFADIRVGRCLETLWRRLSMRRGRWQ